MAALEHIVSRNLQCPVCLELLSDPKQLTCSHTFCKKCLRDILICSTHKSANTLACPICRDDTTVKSGDVVNLKTNFPLKALVDDLKNSQQLCDMCDTKSRASCFCCDCGKNMCKTCLENHNKWPPHLEHRVVSVEDIREGRVVLENDVYCPEHPSERKKRVCTDVCITCKKFICERCRLIDHKDHIVQSAEKYNASSKKQIESLQARGDTKASTVKNHQTCIDSQKKRVTDHIDGRKAQINKIYQESLKKLNERKAALDKQLETEKVKLCKRLAEMKDTDERLVTSIERASVLAGNSLKAPLDCATVLIRDSLSDDMKKVLCRDDPKKKPATDVADRAEQLILLPNNQRDQLNIGEVQFVQCELKCNVEFPKKDSMNFMSDIDDELLVGNRFYGEGMLTVDAEGQMEGSHADEDDVVVIGAGVLSGDKGVVMMTSEDKIIVGVVTNSDASDSDSDDSQDSDEPANLHACETLSQEEGGFASLTVDSNDLIYVSYSKAKKIQVFSPAGGKAIREIPSNEYEPWQIASYKDLLIVTNTWTIRMIGMEGNVKHTVEKWGCRAYAAVTKNDSILIAWVKHNDGLISIDEYTNKLEHIKNIISDQKIEKPDRPWYYLRMITAGEIAFSTPDRLYIFKLTITPTNV